MTVATPARPSRARVNDGQGETLGPIATFGAQVFVFFAVLISFQVTGYDIFPGPTSLVLLGGLFGVVLLTPRMVLDRLPISLPVLAMVGLMIGSTLWTDSPEFTSFVLRQQVPIIIGMSFVAGTITLRRLVPPLLWSIRFSVLLTAVTIAVLPEARIHINPEDASDTLDGWHGLFPHKNIMSPFLVFAVLTVLTFDRRRSTKIVTLLGILAILVGSDSVTGLSSLLLAVSAWVWLQLYRRLDLRNSSVFLISSLSFGVFAVIGLVTSMSAVTNASGKDLTFTGRTFIWAAVWDAITERPILGWGYGGILGGDPVTPRTAEAWRAIGFEVPHAHSGVLDLLVQLGAVGLVVFGCVYVPTLFGASSMLRTRPSVAAWILSTMLTQLYISFSENVFLGSGWFVVLVLFRVLLLRSDGLEIETGPLLADRLRRGQRARRPVGGQAAGSVASVPA